MKGVRNLVFVTLLKFLVFFGFLWPASFAYGSSAKLDPFLSMLSSQTVKVENLKGLGSLKQQATGEVIVSTIARFTGDAEDFKAAVEQVGGRVGSIMGDIATVDISASTLNAFSDLNSVVYVEISKQLKPNLDISVPETGASNLQSGTAPYWTGDTGKNVIIGIVDSGIDISRPDFKDPATGKTRILYLWDQNYTGGTPPTGFAYGTEWTSTQIDNGLCPDTDTDGHGTHVAGIAAGNGSASNYKYVGMAPESNLVIVRCNGGNIDPTSYQNYVLDGIAYIEQKAAQLGKSCTINLSLGQHIDSHDGTSNYCRGLDNASGAGKIIVVSAGNEAADMIHFQRVVPLAELQSVNFSITEPIQWSLFDVWYPGSDSVQICLQAPNGEYTTWVSPDNQNHNYVINGTTIVINSAQNNPNNGDKEISLALLGNPITIGAWKVWFYGTNTNTGYINIWTEPTDFKGAVFSSPSSPLTIVDGACAKKVITVGAYVTKNAGVGWSPYTFGNIAFYSSLGPRRTSTLGDNTVFKPDIVAPGHRIMSSFSKDTVTCIVGDLDASAYYILKQGTSMAAPHVTGAIALMLDRNPSLTPEDIKNHLFTTAKMDGFTGTLPNYIWGYGKLDAYQAVSAYSPSKPTNVSPYNGSTGESLLPTLSASSFSPSTNGGGSQATAQWQVRTVSITYASPTWNLSSTTNLTSTTMPSGVLDYSTTYYWHVRYRDNLGTWSDWSSETSFTTQAAPSDGGGGGGGGGGPVGPLAAGISALLGWWKRRKQGKK